MAETFHEYRHVRQAPDTPRLRWFHSEFFELFAWFAEEELIAFRLCYDRGYQERAITWEKATGHILHNTVDSGGGAIESHSPAPTLVQQQNSIPPRVVERFQKAIGEVPPDIRQLILENLGSVKSGT